MFEAYRIGVTIALTNQVSAGLGLMASQFRGTEKDAAKLKATLKEIKLLGTTGAALGAAGVFGLHALKSPLEEAQKFEQQVSRFKLFGLGDAVTQEAAKYATAMDSMGTTATENMRLMVEAQGVFREAGLSGSAALEGAKLASPMLAKVDYATASLDEESRGKMKAQSLAMLRFIEMRGGLQSPDAFNRIADAGWKAIQSSGGNVNWEQMRQFMARGGVAAQGLNDTALFAKLEPIIGELKGSTAGNAWMTAYNRLIGGVKVPNQVAHTLADNGIWDAKKIEWNSQGGVKRFNGNPLRDMATLSSDPVAFYEKNILPMYAKMNNGKGLDTTERSRENLLIFGRTGGAMFSLIDRQLATIHRSVEANNKALGLDKSQDVASQTLNGKELQLQKQWADLMRELGEAILPVAIDVAQGLINVLKPLIHWMREHQTMTKALVIAFAGLAIMATIGGTILVFTAALKGLMLFLPISGALLRTTAAATGLIPVLGTTASSFLGIKTAAGSASMGLAGLIGLIGRVGLVALGVHEVIKAVDPNDSMGSWMDRKFKWAAAFDDWTARNIGLGRTYAEQADAEKVNNPHKSAAGLAAESAEMNGNLARWAAEAGKPNGGGFAADMARRKQDQQQKNSTLTPDELQTVAGLVGGALADKLDGAAVNMDGRQVGSLVMKQMNREANKPPAGGSGFDLKLQPAYPTGGF